MKLKIDDNNQVISIKVKTPNVIYDRYFQHPCCYTPESKHLVNYSVYPVIERTEDQIAMDSFNLNKIRYIPDVGAILIEHGGWCSFYQVITVS